jgi:hypothetical protein
MRGARDIVIISYVTLATGLDWHEVRKGGNVDDFHMLHYIAHHRTKRPERGELSGLASMKMFTSLPLQTRTWSYLLFLPVKFIPLCTS